MVPSVLGFAPCVPTQKKASGPAPSYVNPSITKGVYMSSSFLSWLLDPVIYLIEYLLCKTEQIHKMTLKMVLDEKSCDFGWKYSCHFVNLLSF